MMAAAVSVVGGGSLLVIRGQRGSVVGSVHELVMSFWEVGGWIVFIAMKNLCN